MKTIHANCVAVDGKGLLILGKSGSGKSTLSLQLLGLGARLVSDDQTILSCDKSQLYAASPKQIVGLIEARGIGILKVPVVSNVAIRAIVDLDIVEIRRLPPHREKTVLGLSLTCFHNVDSPAFPSALLHYLRYGRQDEA